MAVEKVHRRMETILIKVERDRELPNKNGVVIIICKIKGKEKDRKKDERWSE